MRALPALLLIVTGGTALAAGDPPAAVCGQARVLEAVAQRLRVAGQPVVVEAGSAGQVPGERPGIVYCAVRLHSAVYDTVRVGQLPVDVIQVYRYALEMRRNGVFLMP